MESALAVKARRVLAATVAIGDAGVKFALVAKFPELLGSILPDEQLAYLCYIVGGGDPEATRVAKERGLLTNANAGEVLSRLFSDIAGSRAGRENVKADRAEGQKGLAEWLIASFQFTPEAARKIVNAHSAGSIPLPLLAAESSLPLDAEGHGALVVGVCAFHMKNPIIVKVRAERMAVLKKYRLFHAYARTFAVDDDYRYVRVWTFTEDGKFAGVTPELEANLCFLGNILGGYLERFGLPALRKLLGRLLQNNCAGDRDRKALMQLASAFHAVKGRL